MGKHFCFAAALGAFSLLQPVLSLSIRSSVFHGRPLVVSDSRQIPHGDRDRGQGIGCLVMRKQKASDKKTRRRQLEGENMATSLDISSVGTMTTSPMEQTGVWKRKMPVAPQATTRTGGRGRSRKRSTLYQSISFYHNKFLKLLTEEYKAEVSKCDSQNS